jgi:hypothetical protein
MELDADGHHRSAYPASCSGRLMIDNPMMAMDLLDKLSAALPVAARLTPEVQASLRGGNAAKTIPPTCTITGLHYMGDEGGILCKLDLGPKVENEAFVSITHLRFDARLPLARAITTYQKHRVRRLRRQPS